MASASLASTAPRATAQIRVQKPAAEVYDAVVNPGVISKYFTSDASGPLTPGAKVVWTWADAGGAKADVSVLAAEKPSLLRFQWGPAGHPELASTVEITFRAATDDSSTLVNATEFGWEAGVEGTESAVRQTGGWMNMLCCLKVWLEHGIRLREGMI